MALFICYPNCSTCRKAEAWLKEHGVSYTVRHIVEECPTAEEIDAWRTLGGLPLKRFFNTSGMLYRSLGLKERLPSMSEEEQFALLASDGMLVKRPILVLPDRVLVGFRAAEWEAALAK